MRRLLASALFALALLPVPLAMAAGEGEAVGVDPDAVARLGSTDRTLVVGADISVGERVVTGPTGQVQIVFADNTKLVVGPGSALLIEDYLLRNASTAEKITIDTLSGTFRFITGDSPKSAYTLKTPNGTIGVRGTALDITITQQGTLVLLLNGAITACASGGACADFDARCDVASIGGGNSVLLQGGARNQTLGNFPYSRQPSRLLGTFRVNGANSCVVPAPETGGGSLLTLDQEAPDQDGGDGDGGDKPPGCGRNCTIP